MIDVESEDGIAIVTLAHGKANALDIEFCDALTKRLHELHDARAVVLTARGKIFSAGVDLKRVSEGGAGYIRKFLPALHRLYEAAFFHPRPAVAAINGHAIAGGCVLALCADRRVMANGGGRMGVTELLVGVPFPALAFEIMRHTTPPSLFSETVFSGATFQAEAARERGWVHDVTEPDDLREDAVALAQELALLSPPALAQTKQQLRQPVVERLRLSGEATERAVTEIWCAEETLRYIGDYVARTLKKA